MQKMYSVPASRAWWPAVGAPLERGVRQHCARYEDRLTFHARHSATRPAPPQEQSRYSASAAPTKDFAWRSAPCSLELEFGSFGAIPRLRSRRSAWLDLLIYSSGRRPAYPKQRCCNPLAASGGVIVRLDWPALTPALAEIRLFVPLAGFSVSSLHAGPNRNSRLGRLVAVQFTPTGALSAGAPHG